MGLKELLKNKEEKDAFIEFLLKYISEYLWVVGLALMVVGFTMIWATPLDILILGAVLLFISSFLKGLIEGKRRREKRFKSIY